MVDRYDLGTYISYLAWHLLCWWFQTKLLASMLPTITLVACLKLGKLAEMTIFPPQNTWKRYTPRVKCELPPALKMAHPAIDWSPFEDTRHIAFADWISLFFGAGIEGGRITEGVGFDRNNCKPIGWLLLANTTGVNGSWRVGSDETHDPLPPEPAYIIYMANTARLGCHIDKDAILDIQWVDQGSNWKDWTPTIHTLAIGRVRLHMSRLIRLSSSAMTDWLRVAYYTDEMGRTMKQSTYSLWTNERNIRFGQHLMK